MDLPVAADAQGRSADPFSRALAAQLAQIAGAYAGRRALDVGCGPGALTELLVTRLGVDAVSAIDPSPMFVEALHARLPEVDVRPGSAERLPFQDDAFDLALAHLAVHRMADPVAGLSEMARVTRPGGVVAASAWDHSEQGGPLTTFWRAVHDVDPGAPGEADLTGGREGDLAELFTAAGLTRIEPVTRTVTVEFATFADWWEPCALGVGPAGRYAAHLDAGELDMLRARCSELLPTAPFAGAATACCVRARG